MLGRKGVLVCLGLGSIIDIIVMGNVRKLKDSHEHQLFCQSWQVVFVKFILSLRCCLIAFVVPASDHHSCFVGSLPMSLACFT